MATAKRRSSASRKQRRTPPLATIALVVVVAGAAAWWTWGEQAMGYASVGTAYGAKGACSCRYIGGRDLKSCEQDFLPGMELVMLSEDDATRSVTASVPLIASHTAQYREGFGCVLERVGG
ncbi:hypothetical protein D2V17_04850 [Aurantiacibacter xanthus]|uniref:Uncharacterized protein n=1 Tax=Aurantiacibacter xanthus TaxID=1784712 RepID=A0A3A1PAY3_9SPHN|nr:hypothetical protein [Aurantiacibacter xanthus]RIV90102.1 hypothetical protein D2V17_04850 [Aurantiacibacter xanthus]